MLQDHKSHDIYILIEEEELGPEPVLPPNMNSETFKTVLRDKIRLSGINGSSYISEEHSLDRQTDIPCINVISCCKWNRAQQIK